MPSDRQSPILTEDQAINRAEYEDAQAWAEELAGINTAQLNEVVSKNVDTTGTPRPGSWVGEAACKGSIDLFFGVEFEKQEHKEARETRAIAICIGSCGVRDACLLYAVATRQEHGVWGGTTEKERRVLRKAWIAHQKAS